MEFDPTMDLDPNEPIIIIDRDGNDITAECAEAYRAQFGDD